MMLYLKNGNKIHIKEKNKDKFTSYCNGKVTDECILKGKNSSNPAYTEDNVQLVCMAVNQLKSDWDMNTVKYICKMIINNYEN